jgi:hypothetical protein
MSQRGAADPEPGKAGAQSLTSKDVTDDGPQTGESAVGKFAKDVTANKLKLCRPFALTAP